MQTVVVVNTTKKERKEGVKMNLLIELTITGMFFAIPVIVSSIFMLVLDIIATRKYHKKSIVLQLLNLR